MTVNFIKLIEINEVLAYSCRPKVLV